jgi:DNA polymerase III subunit gamma/tau
MTNKKVRCRLTRPFGSMPDSSIFSAGSPADKLFLQPFGFLCYTPPSLMSYTVLARRYRSGTFDEVVGQQHIAQTLKNAISSDRLAHAYLFCGTRGTGKTSMARILAKALNCLAAKAPTTEPCGKCDSCIAIGRGDDIDVIEIDAASNTGVDNVREIIENSQYRPARSRFKVYIIDEVHMLSKSAFNALLKTLEEPPEHVKFILATTEPEKVLPTILSRCQRYDFRNISAKEIAGHLKEICKKEKIQADEDALALVARAGAGSMRDALSLLDRLLSVGEKRLTSETIEKMLGLPRAQLIWELVDSIGSGDIKGVLQQADGIIRAGLSPDALIAALADHLRNLLIVRTCGPDADLLDLPGGGDANLTAQAEKFEPVILAQDIAILEELRRNLRQNQTGRAMIDATLVRLALAEQFTPIGELLAENSSTGTTSVKKKPQPVVKTEFSPPMVQPQVVDRVETAVEAMSAAEPSIEPIGDDDLPKLWQHLMDMLQQQGAAVTGALSLATLSGFRDGKAIIRFKPSVATFAKTWSTNGKRDMIANALTQLRGQPVGVQFEVEEAASAPPVPVAVTVVAPRAASPAPMAADIPTPPRRSTEIPDTVKSDPLVQAVLKEFGGEIVRWE